MPDWALVASHAAVAGTSLYCIINTKYDGYFFARSTFAIIGINSVFGLYKAAVEDGKLDDTYKSSNFITPVLSSPGICANLWHYCRYSIPIALAHYLLPLFVIGKHINGEEPNQNIIDASNAINGVSMCYISFCDENYMGFYASLCHALNSFVLNKEVENVPPDLLRNIGYCFYQIFALHAVNHSSGTCECCKKLL